MQGIKKIYQTFLDTVIPVRSQNTHKGNYGKVLVIGGCVGYTGAPFMTASAAYRTGSGIVYLAVPDSIYAIQASRCEEIVCIPCKSKDGKFSNEALCELLGVSNNCDVCVIGPGLGRSPSSDSLVWALLAELRIPVVLDADGINAVAGNIKILADRKYPTVVTPHDVEFGRLGGDLKSGRVQAAVELARSLGVVMVLKGNRSIVANPDGSTMINTCGNPGMAKGGSGDILAGVIGSLLGQGLQPMDAAAAGVFVHSTAGDLCALEVGEYGMLPSDYMRYIPSVLKKYNSIK